MSRTTAPSRAFLGAAVIGLAALCPAPAAPYAPVVTASSSPSFALTGSAGLALAGRSPRDAALRVLGRAARLPKAAYAAVQRDGGVPTSSGGRCPSARLAVSYEIPGDGWHGGAYVSPLGPAPDDTTTDVNGIVICTGSHYAYAGFDAVFTGGRWAVEVVPDVSEPAGGAADTDTAPRPKPVAPGTPFAGLLDGKGIEGYAPYVGQSTCSPDAKPGTLSLRNLLLARYPSTVSFGISRACDIGGRSEHKEGRAFDWGASVGDATDRAAVESFLSAIFATDSYGNRHALVRRMGIMYVIWNRQIWSAYRADAGWRPYSGVSPHTDHVHISLSWPGALAQTSFWSGTVVAGLPSVPLSSGGSTSSGRVRTVSSGSWSRRRSGGSPAAPPVVHHRRHRAYAPPPPPTSPPPERHRRHRSGSGSGGSDRTGGHLSRHHHRH
jgi:hypothetical protein